MSPGELPESLRQLRHHIQGKGRILPDQAAEGCTRKKKDG